MNDTWEMRVLGVSTFDEESGLIYTPALESRYPQCFAMMCSSFQSPSPRNLILADTILW